MHRYRTTWVTYGKGAWKFSSKFGSLSWHEFKLFTISPIWHVLYKFYILDFASGKKNYFVCNTILYPVIIIITFHMYNQLVIDHTFYLATDIIIFMKYTSIYHQGSLNNKIFTKMAKNMEVHYIIKFSQQMQRTQYLQHPWSRTILTPAEHRHNRGTCCQKYGLKLNNLPSHNKINAIHNTCSTIKND